MRSLRLIFNLIVFAIIIAFVIKVPLLAMDVDKEMEEKKYHAKLESVLGRIADEYSQSGIAMQEFAQQRGVPLENDQVRVILVPLPGEDASMINQASLVSYGAIIEAVSKHLMRARVPVSRLEEIANNVKSVSFIRLPYKPFLPLIGGETRPTLPLSFDNRKLDIKRTALGVISEGVDLVGASDYHELGYKGQGTKVAIIDIGFRNLTNSINHSELRENVRRTINPIAKESKTILKDERNLRMVFAAPGM